MEEEGDEVFHHADEDFEGEQGNQPAAEPIAIAAGPIVVQQAPPQVIEPAPEARQTLKRKADRPIKIVNPQTPEDFFIMLGKIVSEAEKLKEALEEKKEKRDLKKLKLLNLPKVFIKDSMQLKYVEEMDDFKAKLYVKSRIDVSDYVTVRGDADLTQNVMVINDPL